MITFTETDRLEHRKKAEKMKQALYGNTWKADAVRSQWLKEWVSGETKTFS